MLNRWNFLKTGFYEGIKLGRREVIAIRRLYDADFGYGEIAEAMNVSRQTVSNVVNLRTHKRVKDIPFTPIPGTEEMLLEEMPEEMLPEKTCFACGKHRKTLWERDDYQLCGPCCILYLSSQRVIARITAA